MPSVRSGASLIKGISRRNSSAKYHNRKVVINGQLFDSAKEAKRWAELRLMEKAGMISDLRRQVPFELIPSQKRNGKTIERACIYKADFVYKQDGTEIVEDVKGMRTPEYIIKRKLMLWEFGIVIHEI